MTKPQIIHNKHLALKKALHISLLVTIVLVALATRLYRIDTPLADFHSWRQADTAAVARNYVRDGINLLRPTYDDLSNIQSGEENPEGLRMVEFPLYNAAIASLAPMVPLPIEQIGRLIAVACSIIILLVIYSITKQEIDEATALIAAALYAVLPFSIFFSRVVLPETPALAMVFLTLYSLYNYTKGKSLTYLWYAVAVVCAACALLIKPTTIFFYIAFGYLFIRKHAWKLFQSWQPYVFVVLTIAPLIWWRTYIAQFPEGIPASEWLITSINTGGGMERIFMRPSFFRWIFYERITNIILGGLMFPFLVIGAITRQRSHFLYSILISSMVYLIVFQGGNVQHEYYQTLIIPAIVIFTAYGIRSIFNVHLKKIYMLPAVIAVIACTGLALFVSYQRVKTYYDYPEELVQIASVIDSVTTREDKIVTDTLGDTTLLYLSDRRGAPAVFDDLTKLKAKGYRYFITQNGDVIKKIKAEEPFEVMFESNKFAIFRL